MINPKHDTYKTADFLDDISFINAIKHHKEGDLSYWKEWKSSGPSNLKAYEAAELQLRLILSPQRLKPGSVFIEGLWEDINGSIEAEHRHKLRRIQMAILSAAAVLALMLLSVSLWFFNSSITLRTPYGKTQQVFLPDGSQILLNANTELRYPRAYNWKNTREVFLKGEAYFKVSHGSPFNAHTKNLTVQVLGTEFNIKERRGTTLVALIRGKVAIKGSAINPLKPAILNPAELFRFDESTNTAVKTTTNPQVYTAWMDHKVIAENTTVGSIIKDFEDLYGSRIILEDTTLYNRVIDGVVPMGDKENTLFVIANILNVQIRKQGDTILFKTRKTP